MLSVLTTVRILNHFQHTHISHNKRRDILSKLHMYPFLSLQSLTHVLFTRSLNYGNAQAIVGVLAIVLVIIVFRPKRVVEVRSIKKSKVYVSRKQNEVKELMLEKRRYRPDAKDVLVPPNLRQIQLIDTSSDEEEDSKIESKRQGRWFTFGDDEEEDWEEKFEEDRTVDSNEENNSNSTNSNMWNEDRKEIELREKTLDADLRARKDVIRKQREDVEYLSNVAAAAINRGRQHKDKTSSISMITTPPQSNVRNDAVSSVVKNVLLEMKRRKEDKILAVHMEEARRVALVAAQAAKIAYVVFERGNILL